MSSYLVFKMEMHQNCFLSGLCGLPQIPRGAAYDTFPDPLVGWGAWPGPPSHYLPPWRLQLLNLCASLLRPPSQTQIVGYTNTHDAPIVQTFCLRHWFTATCDV